MANFCNLTIDVLKMHARLLSLVYGMRNYN